MAAADSGRWGGVGAQGSGVRALQGKPVSLASSVGK